MKNSKKTIYILSIVILNIALQGFYNHDEIICFTTIEDVIELIQEQKNEGRYQGSSPLHFIADGSNEHELSIAIELIEQGANVNDQDNQTKETPLHLAALWNNLPLAKILIDAGANVNTQDKTGSTPLHNVALYDGENKNEFQYNLEIARLLINHGADLTLADDEGKTAAIVASEFNNMDLYTIIAEAIILNTGH